MPRQPKLRKKNGYWHTRAGGRDVYFGKVGQLIYRQAQQAFQTHLQALAHSNGVSESKPPVTVLELCSRYLDWCEEHRSSSTYKSRKSILGLWCNHQIQAGNLPGHGLQIGDVEAAKISRRHLEEYLEARKNSVSQAIGKPIGPVSLRAIVVVAKATWNWAADSEEDGGGGLLPADFRPFGKVPRGFIPPKDLTEGGLITDKEIKALFKFASADTGKIRDGNGRYRRRRRGDRRVGQENPYHSFQDMLRVFYSTGARTGEICSLRVRDFLPRTKQLTLGKHKRVNTQRNSTLRNIQLGAEAYKIIKRYCAGKMSDQPIFAQHNGRPWTRDWLTTRFREVRKLAGVRPHLTIYSYRDLYISELLLESIPPFEVSKMAGTSLKEIERTYGHFFNHKLAEAQARLDAARAQRKKRKLQPA